MKIDKKVYIPLSVVGGLALLAWLFNRPWMHGLMFGGVEAVGVQPASYIIFTLLITTSIIGLITAMSSYRPNTIEKTLMVAGAISLLLTFAFWGWRATTYRKAVAQSYSFKEIDHLYNTKAIRWTAYEIAAVDFKEADQNTTTQTGDIDPHFIGGEFIWQSPQVPEGPANQLSQKSEGVYILSDGGAVEFHPQVFECGEEMWFGHSIYWNMYDEKYSATFPEVFYWPSENGFIAVAPYISYIWEFPIQYPIWGGVMVIEPNCHIDNLTPKQAINDPRLKGAQIFPEKLASIQISHWHYKYGGLINDWWKHVEEFDVPALPISTNEQPYYLPWEEVDLQWTFTVDPEGSGKSVVRFYYFDVITGDVTMADLTKIFDKPAIGMEIAAQEIEGRFTSVKWGGEGGFFLIEGRPVVKDGWPYWMFSMTKNSYVRTSAVILLDMINYDESSALIFCSADQLDEWFFNDGPSNNNLCDEFDNQSTNAPTRPSDDQNPSIPFDIEDYSNEDLLDIIQRILEEIDVRGLGNYLKNLIYWGSNN